ncbi:MAG: hypothetical protein Q9180_003519 [Flavoplaca navasiana]
MAKENRITDIIAERLSKHLSTEVFKAQALIGTRLVIQGYVQASNLSDQRLIDLGSIDLSDIVSPLPSNEQKDSTGDIVHQRIESQRTFENELPTPCHLLPTPPKSPIGGPHLQDMTDSSSKRRKVVGGLRPVSVSSKCKAGTTNALEELLDGNPHLGLEMPRQLQSDTHKLPQRRKIIAGRPSKAPRSAITVIGSIWKTVYGPITIDPTATFEGRDTSLMLTEHVSDYKMDQNTFARINALCLKATTLSKSARALEVIVQAHWIDCYDARIEILAEENPRLSPTEARMAGLVEACTALGWTQKELRNRMMIWRGYKEIKDAGGWVCLVFTGSGIYSTCKYRVGFADGLLQRLKKIRASLEVAADTLHPNWRQLLIPVGATETQRRYTGHPHHWVVDGEKDAIPLPTTYHQWDPDFSFQHLVQCILDDCWHSQDPRLVCTGNTFTCSECGQMQSDDPQLNKCVCFAVLSSCNNIVRIPVQVARCPHGKNNGLFARCAFERGTAVGEFVGLVTRGIEGVDVMMGGHGDTQYQIYQGRLGNYTRFINHSCAPNAQFTKFVFCGIERILVVSKGIEAGMEITVDYSSSYWNKLDKICLCGESCCRYQRKKG